MLFKRDILDGIAAGTVTMAFRRWRRPTVRVGGTLRTAVGVLRFTDIATVGADAISERDAARAGFASALAVRAALGPDDGTPIYRIAFRCDGADPRAALRRDDRLDAAALTDIVARLARLDRTRQTPWTERSLRLIADNPGARAAEPGSGRGSGARTLELPRWPLASLASAARAADLAARDGRERAAFKLDIRKLKELGLTESLEVGYRVSPRGRALLRHLAALPADRQ